MQQKYAVWHRRWIMISRILHEVACMFYMANNRDLGLNLDNLAAGQADVDNSQQQQRVRSGVSSSRGVEDAVDIESLRFESQQLRGLLVDEIENLESSLSAREEGRSSSYYISITMTDSA